MRNTYILRWLDHLITVKLNPRNNQIVPQPNDRINGLLQRLLIEQERIRTLLLVQIFSFATEGQSRSLIRRYHSSLSFLLDAALDNRSHVDLSNTKLVLLNDRAIQCTKSLLSFIEARFHHDLGEDVLIPNTYIILSAKEVTKQLEELEISVLKKAGDEKLVAILFGYFRNIGFSGYVSHDTTFGEMKYWKEWTSELANLNHKYPDTEFQKALNRTLVYLNFNHKDYVDYCLENMESMVRTLPKIEEKIVLVHGMLKEYRQMPTRHGVAYQIGQPSIHTTITNWLFDELAYLKAIVFASGSAVGEPDNKHTGRNKVLCALSVDQIALLLRAADDLKILLSRSLNHVFKTIVPHLSTPSKQDISWDSMRSKSYAAETKDKEIIIDWLQQAIKKIKEY